MAQPDRSQVHVDVPLTNISIAYRQSTDAFIADKVFPTIDVDQQSGRYFVFSKADFFRDEAQLRSSSEESVGSGYSVSSGTYYCDRWALHKDIDDADRANTDAPLNADRNAAQFLMQRLLLRRERQWVSDYFATSIWGTDNTTATDWDDYGASDPIGDIETAKAAILQNTGFEANTLVLGYEVMKALKNHPDIVDRIKYTSQRSVDVDVVASLCGIKRVLVAKAVRNAAAENKSASMAFVHGKHALLCHVADAPALETPSAGYGMAWKGLAPGLSQAGILMRKFRMEHLTSDRIEGELAMDFKVTGSDLGYFFSGVVA